MRIYKAIPFLNGNMVRYANNIMIYFVQYIVTNYTKKTKQKINEIYYEKYSTSRTKELSRTI